MQASARHDDRTLHPTPDHTRWRPLYRTAAVAASISALFIPILDHAAHPAARDDLRKAGRDLGLALR